MDENLAKVILAVVAGLVTLGSGYSGYSILRISEAS